MSGFMNDQQKVIDQEEKWGKYTGIIIHPGIGDLPFKGHPELIGKHPAKGDTDQREPPLLYVGQYFIG
jgi:hypothetical protein